MLERVDAKSFRLFCPYFADVFIRGEALEGLEPPGEIIGHQEAVHVRFQLFVRGVVITFHRGLLDGSVHAFNLPVCPGMLWLGEPVFNLVFIAAEIEPMRAPLSRRPVAITGRMTELAAVIGQDRMDLVWNVFDQIAQEGR